MHLEFKQLRMTLYYGVLSPQHAYYENFAA